MQQSCGARSGEMEDEVSLCTALQFLILCYQCLLTARSTEDEKGIFTYRCIFPSQVMCENLGMFGVFLMPVLPFKGGQCESAGFFHSSLCTCFSELSSLVPCPTFEVSLNNKEKGKFASSLLLLLN